MKTKKQIQSEIEHGEVMTMKEFLEDVFDGCLDADDGGGYLHDGENAVDVSCWDALYNIAIAMRYPYVIWIND